MAVSKLSVSVPGWLEPIIRDAAGRDGVSVSAFLADAAKTVIIEREAAERRQYEAGHGIDRRAQVETAEREFLNDRAAMARRVEGAA
jgi:hypothetical protein